METPSGTIIFTTVGRTHYGFDVFSLHIASAAERRLTDGVSVNFNAQFADDNGDIVFVSERAGSARIFRTRPGNSKPEQLPGAPESFFHDRPAVTKNNRLYFISAHEQPDRHFKNWSALYTAKLDSEEREVTRVTPLDTADFSPAVSKSGEYLAVASYGSRSWGGEFHEINTDIVVFRASEPETRVVVCERGGWPTWSGDSTVFFHHQADDGWWSIFRVDLPENFKECSKFPVEPIRVTPSGLHCFTPAAFHDGKRIAVATRRRGVEYRHIEIFDLENKTFQPVTEPLNPSFHHYSPFVSADSEFIGYHRFRGESTQGESIVPNLESIVSPIKTLRLLRLNGSFPSSSPDGDLIALNSDFDINGGIKVAKSDGSKRWTLIKDRTAFYNSWSPTERHVIYASLGPIFRPAGIAVQIARIKFDPSDLTADKEVVPCEVKILTLENTVNNAFPSCSPDGKSVVFRSGRSGHKNLYILDAVNGESNGGDGIRRLTEGPWIDTMPCWSPKGDLIGFSSNRHNPANTDAFGAYVVRPDGSGLRRIQVAGLEGSEEAARERINHVSFNKDGDWLVFTANLGGITAEPVAMPNQFQPYGDLYVVKVDGTGLKRLTWNGYEDGTPTWHTVDDLDLSRLSLNGQDGDKLEGQFEEPLWISCDI
uniref:Protein TolB n=1 Tax=Noccaea caerulescens TaxID=107243 RepID=A0A1J3FQ33_NOCCA